MTIRPLARLTAAVLVSACARSGDASSSFSGGSHSGAADTSSTSAGSPDTSTSSTGPGVAASGEDSSPAATGDSTDIMDVGVQPDFVPSPVGCAGKIDFLFLVSRYGLMEERQDRLAAAFPDFIETIESKFADFDYHIMVVDGDGPWPDGWWGSLTCNEVCPNLACKVGQDCCGWDHPDYQDTPCCQDPNYPCEGLEQITSCDVAWGAGTVFPAGPGTEDKPCPIDGDRRYLVKGQTGLAETFACIATVGISGSGLLGQALTAAMQKPINDYGGCNELFLRDDALLMVTFISDAGDSGGGVGVNSEGTPEEWAQAVLDAKHGDPNSVVMLNIGYTECTESDGLCRLAAMFPLHRLESHDVADYGPAFAESVDLVDEACAMFVPPPG